MCSIIQLFVYCCNHKIYKLILVWLQLNHELPEKIKERKAYGGHKKLKALRIQEGNFTLKSCGNIRANISTLF